MHPMTSARHVNDFGRVEVTCAAILLGIGIPAFGTSYKQSWTRNACPERLTFFFAQTVWREDANVVIELPAIGPILVLVDTVNGEMVGLVGC